jgi:hypothetical protein
VRFSLCVEFCWPVLILLTGHDKIVPNSQVSNPDSDKQSGGEELTSPNPCPPPVRSSHGNTNPTAIAEAPQSLLSILASKGPSTTHHANSPTTALDPSSDKPQTPPCSRLFPNPISHNSHSRTTESTGKMSPEPVSAPAFVQFNPPQSSRLLALGSRPPPSMPTKSEPSADHLATNSFLNGRSNGSHNMQPTQTNTPQNAGILQADFSVNQGVLKSDSLRSAPGFSPFEDQNHSSSGLDEHIAQSSDSLHQAPSERIPFTSTSESGAHSDSPSFDPSGAASNATGKGSRFAKFFDNKGREGQPPVAKAQTPAAFVSSSPISTQRQEQGGFNGVLSGNADHRAMDDLFAMLNSSAQVSCSRSAICSQLTNLFIGPTT